MDNLSLAEEFERFADITIIDQPQKIVVGDTSFLFCGKIFMQVSQNISLYPDILHIGRYTGCCLRKDSGRMIDEVRVKSGFSDILFTETARELVENASHHFEMRQFFRPHIGEDTGNFTVRHTEPLTQVPHGSSKFPVRSAELRNNDLSRSRIGSFDFDRKLKFFFIYPHNL